MVITTADKLQKVFGTVPPAPTPEPPPPAPKPPSPSERTVGNPQVMAEGQRIYNPSLPPTTKPPTAAMAEQGTAPAMDTSGAWGKPSG